MFFFKRSIPYRQGYPIVSYLIRKSIYTYTFESHFHRFNKTIFIKIHTVDTNLPVIRSCIAQRMTMINDLKLLVLILGQKYTLFDANQHIYCLFCCKFCLFYTKIVQKCGKTTLSHTKLYVCVHENL